MHPHFAMPARSRIYTIGHGGRSVGGLIWQLRDRAIDLLVDVRSAPYSRYQPAFSREPLARRVRAAGLDYSFLGRELGGRPNDPACYDTQGHIDYIVVRSMPFFRDGIRLLQDACRRGYTACLLCAEADPARCHRTKMVGVHLESVGIEVIHLLRDGGTRSQREVMLARGGGNERMQQGLFGGAV